MTKRYNCECPKCHSDNTFTYSKPFTPVWNYNFCMYSFIREYKCLDCGHEYEIEELWDCVNEHLMGEP